MEQKDTDSQPVKCTCMDSLAALPPELRPRPRKKSGLRQVTCPGCGLVYRTNRPTDVCIECEKKGVKMHQQPAT